MVVGQGYAKVNYSPDERKTFYLDSQDNTNNEAELFSILCGITEALRLGYETIYSDSKVCINICTGEYKVKEPRLKLLAKAIHTLLREYKIKLEWKSREELWAT